MEDHRHDPTTGRVIIEEPAAVAEPAVAEAEAVEEVADAEVRIAEINAKRDVEIAKLAAKAEESEENSELERLRGEVRALREIVERLAPPEPEPEPEPEPVPVVVDAPEEEVAPAPEPVESSEPPAPKKSRGFWGPAYR